MTTRLLPDAAFLPNGATTLDAIVAPPELLKQGDCGLPQVSVHPDYLNSDLFRQRCVEARTELDRVLSEVMVSQDATVLSMAVLLSQLTIASADFLVALYRRPQYRLTPHPLQTMGVSHDTLLYHPDVVLWAVGRRLPIEGQKFGRALANRRKRLMSVLLHEAMHYSEGDLALLLTYQPMMRQSPVMAHNISMMHNLVCDAIHDRALTTHLKNTSQNVFDVMLLSQHANDMHAALSSLALQMKAPVEPRDALLNRITRQDVTKGQALAQLVSWLPSPTDMPDGGGGELDLPSEAGGDELGHIIMASEPNGETDMTPQNDRELRQLQAEVNTVTDNNKHVAAEATAASIGSEAGVLGLKQKITRTLRPVDWRQLLQEVLATTAAGQGSRSDFRRYRSEPALQRIYMPRKVTHQMSVAALMDVSGSMWCEPDSFQKMLYTLTTVALAAGTEALDVVPFDVRCYPTLHLTEVHQTTGVLDIGGGGGGTSLDKPLREFAKRIDTSEVDNIEGGSLIIGTDAYVAVPDPALIAALRPAVVVWMTGEIGYSHSFIEQVTGAAYATRTGARALHLKVA